MSDLTSSSPWSGVELESTGRRLSSLRVGMVTHYMPPHIGGIENVAEALFRVYRATGCDVRWVASQVLTTAEPHEDGRIHVGCWNGFERWLGVPWPIWGPAGVREVARLVRWADVLHIHDCLYMGSALAVMFACRAQKPVLLSQHIGFVRYPSVVLNGLEHFAYYRLGRAVLRRTSHVVFCTPTAEEFVTVLLDGRPAGASAIPYGIDTSRFRPATPAEHTKARRNLGLPESGLVVLFAGRLVEKKGVDLFLEVSRRMPSYHFLMVGDGPLRPPGMGNLTWIPFVPPDQMDMVYHAADVLLLPSHGEGFPLSIIEAMAAGLPVITSRGQTFANLLEVERACLVAERTPTALCEALGRLLETPGLATAIAARARELGVRDYSFEVMGARYLKLIHELTGKS